jgi:AraC-like DNA-binding protein/quercetin dioxygenase-like cupin family protein
MALEVDAMSELQSSLRETQNIGGQTTEYIVPSSACPTLADSGVFSVGVSFAKLGFRFVRHQPEISVILISLAGSGRVYVNGEWQTLATGAAYIAPPLALHAYEATQIKTWRICWAAFNKGTFANDFLGFKAPAIVSAETIPLQHLINALYQEYIGAQDTHSMRQLSELISHYSRRLISNLFPMPTISNLLALIAKDLSRSWKVKDLAAQMGMSSEKLRLICHRQLGRSLGKHITLMRMQRATHLLTYTDWTVEDVARSVGYSDPFAFSTAFRRVVSEPPSQYRERRLRELNRK